MRTSGRGSSEKLMIIIPAAVLLFVVVVITGGPTQFVQTLNVELGQLVNILRNWMMTWAA